MSKKISKSYLPNQPAPSITPVKQTFMPDSSPIVKKASRMNKDIDRRDDTTGSSDSFRQEKKTYGTDILNPDKLSAGRDSDKSFSVQALNKSLRNMIEMEYRRHRPLVIIQSTSASHGRKDDEFTLGCDYLKKQLSRSELFGDSFNSKNLFKSNDTNLHVFFGQGNHQHRQASMNVMKTIDPEGVLIYSILQANEKPVYRPAALCSVALIAACLSAGYLGPVAEEDAKHSVDNLSPGDQQDALGLALVASARGAFYTLAKIVLSWGAPVDTASEDDGSLPLEIAILGGDVRLAKLLLDHGADPDAELVSGITCRDIAGEQKLSEFKELFK